MGSKKGRGSQKGGSFERKVCKSLSLWASGGTRDDVYWRSAMSGGRATISNRTKGKRKNRSQLGDITAIHSSGEALTETFLVECKHKKNLHTHSWVFGFPGFLPECWLKPLKDARAFDMQPLCVLKQNGKIELCLTTKSGFDLLNSSCIKRDLPLRCIFEYQGDWVYVFRYQDLIGNVNYKVFAKHVKALGRSLPRVELKSCR